MNRVAALFAATAASVVGGLAWYAIGRLLCQAAIGDWAEQNG